MPWLRRGKAWDVAAILIVTALAIMSLMPLYWMVSTAFTQPTLVVKMPPDLIPSRPTLHNFRDLFTRRLLGRWTLNSAIVAVSVTVAQLFVASLAGYAFAKKEFIGRNFAETARLQPEDLPKTRAKFSQVMAGSGTTTPTDLTLTRSDGTHIPVEVTAYSVTIDGRHLVLAISRDVSERRQLEDFKKKALIQIEENIEQLAILNDSIRNPLTVIIALAEIGGTEVNQKIIEAAWEIDDIIDQLVQGWLISRKVKDFLKRHYS